MVETDDVRKREEHMKRLVQEVNVGREQQAKEMMAADKALPSRTRFSVQDIHRSWSVKTLIREIGPERTVREMKLRCEAGAIVGCSIYLNLITKFMRTAMQMIDPAARGPAESFMEYAGEMKWIDRIEKLHAEYPPKIDPRRNEIISGIPLGVQQDLIDDYMMQLEKKVGKPIPLLPEHASQEDIKHSREVSERLARGEEAIVTKPEIRPREEVMKPEIVPEPVPVEKIIKKEEREPEKKPISGTHAAPRPELVLMQEEIQRRIEELKKKKAMGQSQAGESPGGYLPKKGSSASYAEFHHLVQTIQDVELLKTLRIQINASELVKFDKEQLNEEIISRIQDIHESEIIAEHAEIVDPDEWVKSKGVSFKDEIRGAHHGQVDGTLYVYDAKTLIVIGRIDYSLFEEFIYLDLIEVTREHRRKGFATALLLKLKQINPGKGVKWGVMTEEGCSLKNDIDKGIDKGIAESGGRTQAERREIAKKIAASAAPPREVVQGETPGICPGRIDFPLCHTCTYRWTIRSISKCPYLAPEYSGIIMESSGSDETLIKKAKLLGIKAFKDGIKAPAHDKQMLDLMKGMKPGEAVPILEAWNKGWTAANLAADVYNIEDINGIKQAAAKGIENIWIVNKGREGVILAAKYGKDWWEKANRDDIERITVYESGGVYSEIHEGDANNITEPQDYRQWTVSDFEVFVETIDDPDELEEILEYIGASEKITEIEANDLRARLLKRIKDIQEGVAPRRVQ